MSRIKSVFVRSTEIHIIEEGRNEGECLMTISNGRVFTLKYDTPYDCWEEIENTRRMTNDYEEIPPGGFFDPFVQLNLAEPK